MEVKLSVNISCYRKTTWRETLFLFPPVFSVARKMTSEDIVCSHVIEDTLHLPCCDLPVQDKSLHLKKEKHQ